MGKLVILSVETNTKDCDWGLILYSSIPMVDRRMGKTASVQISEACRDFNMT